MGTACLLITRPEPSATRFAAAARAGGWYGDALIAPLLNINLSAQAIEIAQDETVIFTSQHAVAALCAQTARRDWPVWCVGPTTAQAARAAGFGQVHQSGGDALALLADLRGHHGPFVHLRGQHAVMDLAGALREAGAAARDQIVYAQTACPLSARARAALASPQTKIVAPVFSPRSAALLAQALTKTPCRASLEIVAISAQAAAQISGVGRDHLHIASHPTGAAMLDAVLRLQPALEPRTKPR